jgi:hypothetical protein
VYVDHGSGTRLDRRHHAVLKDRIGHGEHDAVRDARKFGQHGFHERRQDFFAASIDDVIAPTDMIEETQFAPFGEVAGSQPFAGNLLGRYVRRFQ